MYPEYIVMFGDSSSPAARRDASSNFDASPADPHPRQHTTGQQAANTPRDNAKNHPHLRLYRPDMEQQPPVQRLVQPPIQPQVRRSGQAPVQRPVQRPAPRPGSRPEPGSHPEPGARSGMRPSPMPSRNPQATGSQQQQQQQQQRFGGSKARPDSRSGRYNDPWDVNPKRRSGPEFDVAHRERTPLAVPARKRTRRNDVATYMPRLARPETPTKAIVDIVVVALSTVIAMYFFNVFIAQSFHIPPTGSMLPTIQDNDYVVANKAIYAFSDIHRSDIVIVETTKAQRKQLPDNPKYLIKRVVAVGGDTLETREGVVYINGEPFKEPYLNPELQTLVRNPTGGDDIDMAPFLVPKGQVFVMGDNRNHSGDSRVIGTLGENQIVGRADFRFWPLSRLGFL